MTRKERFMAAVKGETPDVVPVAPLIHARFADRVLGRSDLASIFEVHRMLGSTHHRGPLSIDITSELPEGYAVEWREVGRASDGTVESEELIRTPGRTLKRRRLSGMIPDDPLVGKSVEYPVKTVEDWKVMLDYRQQWLDGITGADTTRVQEAIGFMGNEGIAGVGICGAYTTLGDVRGMQEFIMDLVDHPDLMDELFALDRRMLRAYVEAFVVSPAEVGWLDICWATGSNLGPELFERWAFPDVLEAMDVVRDVPGKYLGLYTLGRIRKLLPMLVDAGVDFIETFEPNEGDISLGEANRLYGDRTCLMGNFDCMILSFGGIEDARKEALRCLEEGMAGGGYVMATADEVPADAKLDNLKVMVETVEKHGRY